jgi:hypothetical protein
MKNPILFLVSLTFTVSACEVLRVPIPFEVDGGNDVISFQEPDGGRTDSGDEPIDASIRDSGETTDASQIATDAGQPDASQLENDSGDNHYDGGLTADSGYDGADAGNCQSVQSIIANKIGLCVTGATQPVECFDGGYDGGLFCSSTQSNPDLCCP